MTETAQVLCIVNTRKRARQVYESLPEEGRFHLSTLMIPTDREKTLNAIRTRLQNGKTCRVVSTSLVEAGVDVDFPSVWRELAGLDSILQAAGRCNREGRRSAAESVVHVFEAEGGVQEEIEKRQNATKSVIDKFLDFNTRTAIQAYFKRLFILEGSDFLDNEKILEKERARMFQETAGKLQIIDKKGAYIVYIPDEENEEDITLLRTKQYSRKLFRRLGKCSVNVHQNDFNAMVLNGAIEDYRRDGFGILIKKNEYSPLSGLKTDSEDSFISS